MADVVVRFLSREDVLAAGGGDMRAAIADVRAALALLRAGEAEMPAETSVRLGSAGISQARAYALPARLGGEFAAAGLKWTAHRPPSDDGAPAILSMTTVNDATTGRPVGIVESALLTAMRTAAVSALVLDRAASTVVRRAALLGAGVQARTHLRMLAELFPQMASVTVWNRTRAHAERMVAAARPHAPWTLTVAPDIAAALDGADAVITCTNAAAPILDADAMAAGRIVLQIGYHEVAFDAIDRAHAVLVDLWGDFRLTSAKSLFQMHRAGRFDAARIAADLAQLVLDGWRPPRGAAVFFSAFGLNLFDIALAARVLRNAEAGGRGTTLKLSGRPGGEWSW
jgi:ornithine cyclodeaminase